ncbi:MAG: serine/threonine-protein kinase, partial [Planctomycetota bacterium]|nr:serine/threonine-protein kinase [Planctomycetota bacterium]
SSNAIAWFGDYEILGEISRGGMAIVYKARQPKLNRIVALKILLDRAEADPKDIERFRREAIAISTLRHPGIVAVFEVGEIDGVEFYTMDYVEGTTLDKAVILESLGAEEIAQVFVKVCDALHFAHSRKILHRDIKPKNILLNRREEPVIVDFGIAKKEGDNELSGEFEILGSPAYLAPEYISGDAPYDIRAEIYATGTTLYQLLSGKNPNDDVDTKHIFTNAKAREIVPLKSIAGSVPPVLNEIVMTSLSKDPNKRYQSAREMADDLRRFLDGQEIHANYSPLVLKWRVMRIKVILALVLIVSVILTFSSGYYTRRLSTQDMSIEELKETGIRWENQFYQAKYEQLERLIKEKRYEELKKQSATFYKTFPGAKRSEAGLELRKRIDKLVKRR